MLQIDKVYTEYRHNPLGLDTQTPRFSWKLVSDKQNVMQQSYRITVAAAGHTVWDTGIVNSSRSIHITYEGEPLEHSTQYDVLVLVNDNQGETTCASAGFETGLMQPGNWLAEWITSPAADSDVCPVFIHTFTLGGNIKKARLYSTALGVYEAELNGEKIGQDYLAPGWTSYGHRLQYQTHDITGLLTENNHISVAVGKGWYTGEIGFRQKSNHYGSKMAILLQILVEYADGTKETICTDNSWKQTTGCRRYAEIYHGETIDCTADAGQPEPVEVLEHPKDILVSQECEPVRPTQIVPPQKVFTTPKGELVLDFGQNLVGVVQAELECARGTTVTLRFAEVLDKEGNFYTANLRGARATDTFVCSGSRDVFRPAFTFHGFRYVQVEGLPKDIDMGCFKALVLHSDLPTTGGFSCSHEGINQLQSNILWSQKGNFLDIPTDCPQRDERLGWTGDAQVFCGTAAFNMNVALFFKKWLRDVAAEQSKEQGVPYVIPNVLEDEPAPAGWEMGAAVWGDVATIIPWEIFNIYGDSGVLREQYTSMKDWVEYIHSHTEENGLWQSGFQFGDWLALDEEQGADRIGATDVYMVANIFYAHSTLLLARAAEVLGFEKEASAYKALHAQILAAFQKEYITATGRLVSETQTGCVLVLHFDMAQEKHRPKIVRALVDNLHRHNDHLVTGFAGTPYLCHVLSRYGHHALAGKLLLQQDYPSWLYPVSMGATTIWERWNSMQPDGSIEDNGMNSFNHYAYGSIGEWMYRQLGGISPLEPGYKKSLVAPKPIEGIHWARAALDTMHGTLSCKWKLADNGYLAEVTVPVNTKALLVLPGQPGMEIGSGQHRFRF